MNRHDHELNPWLLAWQLASRQQLAAIRTAETLWQSWFVLQQHLVKEGLDLIDAHHPHRRAHGGPGDGPDLMDHYGHRAHDVDVERL